MSRFLHIYYLHIFFSGPCTYIHEKRQSRLSVDAPVMVPTRPSTGYCFSLRNTKPFSAESQEQQPGVARHPGLAADAVKAHASVPRTMASLTGTIPNQNYKCVRTNKAGVNLKLFYTLFHQSQCISVPMCRAPGLLNYRHAGRMLTAPEDSLGLESKALF